MTHVDVTASVLLGSRSIRASIWVWWRPNGIVCGLGKRYRWWTAWIRLTDVTGFRWSYLYHSEQVSCFSVSCCRYTKGFLSAVEATLAIFLLIKYARLFFDGNFSWSRAANDLAASWDSCRPQSLVWRLKHMIPNWLTMLPFEGVVLLNLLLVPGKAFIIGGG
jgi:hypothetical protein